MSGLVMSRMQQALIAFGLIYTCTVPSLVQASDLKELEGRVPSSSVDGIYKGNTQPIPVNAASCQSGSEVALEVHAGRMKLPWTDHQFFDAKIMDDGSFFATTIPTVQAEKHMTLDPTLAGHIGPGGLTADYGTRFCRYRLVATRSLDGQHLSGRTDAPGSRR
jgi:hypothetical protein